MVEQMEKGENTRYNRIIEIMAKECELETTLVIDNNGGVLLESTGGAL